MGRCTVHSGTQRWNLITCSERPWKVEGRREKDTEGEGLEEVGDGRQS